MSKIEASKIQPLKFNVSKWSAIVSATIVITFYSYRILLFQKRCYQLHQQFKLDYVQESYFGLYKDVSDSQWTEYYESLHIILILAVVFLISSGILKYLCKRYDWNVLIFNYQKQFLYQRKYVLMRFNIIIGLGTGVIFWIIFTLLFYITQMIFVRSRYFSIILWTLVISVLYNIEQNTGYQFIQIHQSLQWLDEMKKQELIRWHVLFNLTILRLISFCLDKHWMIRDQHSKGEDKPSTTTLKERIQQPQPLQNYNIINFYGFLLYTPLFITGPQITYNAFVSQIDKSQNTYSNREVVRYTLKVLFIDLITFEIYQHINFANAISKVPSNQSAWKELSIMELYDLSFFNLIFIWLKFLNFWRIARAWALIDGIETPENMNRCIFNNYCFQGFWRGWHRSFNQWLIRYLFVPLGGSRFKIINMWVVFGFVAIWHDFNINLLMWAWVICLALFPEILVQQYFNNQKRASLWSNWWWKYLCGMAGGLQIMMMIFANLVGFGGGWENISTILVKFNSAEGVAVILIQWVIVSIATQYMFYMRDYESVSY